MEPKQNSPLRLSDVSKPEPSILGALRDDQFRTDVVRQAKKLVLMPEQSPFGVGDIPTEADMAKMPWLDLMALRKKLKTTADQNAVAPFEHRAYARENSTSPLEAFRIAAATPFYSAAKIASSASQGLGATLPIGGSRSDPSLREIGQGLRGAWEGLTK